MMGYSCCNEFIGWCKSFTKTEIFLCVLQAIFLAVFLAFLTFLILHLVVCSRDTQEYKVPKVYQTLSSNSTKNINTEDNYTKFESSTDYMTTKNVDKIQPLLTIDLGAVEDTAVTAPNTTTTLDKRIKCTWSPSQTTKAYTHYYENNQVTKLDNRVIDNKNSVFQKNKFHEDSPDGKEINDSRKNFLTALVKIKPQRDITFGCTLTIISEYWTLTAASCIEAVEEVDSLDSFVMMQGLQDHDQDIHAIANVMIHPLYQGVNATFDLAALQSEDRLVRKGTLVLTLPSLLDYFLITIGETLTILGFGRFRSIDRDTLTRTVREVSLYRLPLSQCPTGAGTWAPRHLTGGTPVEHGARGTSPICAGVLRSRTSPCNYCSGTPLVRSNLLLGVMSDYQHCGVSCEPALFVNLARVRDWLDSVLSY